MFTAPIDALPSFDRRRSKVDHSAERRSSDRWLALIHFPGVLEVPREWGGSAQMARTIIAFSNLRNSDARI
jgi:hypothetical protein